MLFHEKGAVKAVQNIGGIANLTVVPEKINKVMAFDTGPGMSLIDEAVKLLTKGRMHYDINGALAKKGKAITPLLDKLLAHPYFKKHPPKSTGRETFGKAMVKEIITGYGNAGVEDILSTLTRFTAISIQRAYRDFVLPEFKVSEIILCGGGCKNKFLLTLLKDLLAPVMLTPVEKYGIPYKAKEALSFAILANETLSGRAGNIVGATGAKHPVILGKITP
jgi:anhydro-N-acetylmuramic acid kinase